MNYGVTSGERRLISACMRVRFCMCARTCACEAVCVCVCVCVCARAHVRQQLCVQPLLCRKCHSSNPNAPKPQACFVPEQFPQWASIFSGNPDKFLRSATNLNNRTLVTRWAASGRDTSDSVAGPPARRLATSRACSS